ncbi:hypothetical protein QBC44DRAFT_303394 [Cladorrhinum sp. PSN332]|nr:hypothetical protein QBC44DRAFT_303394 [Cladorrhinum sp. PSN332]
MARFPQAAAVNGNPFGGECREHKTLFLKMWWWAGFQMRVAGGEIKIGSLPTVEPNVCARPSTFTRYSQVILSQPNLHRIIREHVGTKGALRSSRYFSVDSSPCPAQLSALWGGQVNPHIPIKGVKSMCKLVKIRAKGKLADLTVASQSHPATATQSATQVPVFSESGCRSPGKVCPKNLIPAGFRRPEPVGRRYRERMGNIPMVALSTENLNSHIALCLLAQASMESGKPAHHNKEATAHVPQSQEKSIRFRIPQQRKKSTCRVNTGQAQNIRLNSLTSRSIKWFNCKGSSVLRDLADRATSPSGPCNHPKI